LLSTAAAADDDDDDGDDGDDGDGARPIRGCALPFFSLLFFLSLSLSLSPPGGIFVFVPPQRREKRRENPKSYWENYRSGTIIP